MAGVTDYTLLADCARGLNVEERCGLTAAITKRQHEEGITGLAFWGKITGTQKDYLVCCAVDTSTDFPAKQFYYCVAGNYELKKLSNKLLSGAQASLAQSLAATYTFSGDPTKPLEEEKTEEPSTANLASLAKEAEGIVAQLRTALDTESTLLASLNEKLSKLQA